MKFESQALEAEPEKTMWGTLTILSAVIAGIYNTIQTFLALPKEAFH